MQQVQEFNNLGNVLIDDVKCDTATRRRIDIEKYAFPKLNNVLSNRKNPLESKKSLLNHEIITVVLYDCEFGTNFSQKKRRLARESLIDSLSKRPESALLMEGKMGSLRRLIESYFLFIFFFFGCVNINRPIFVPGRNKL